MSVRRWGGGELPSRYDGLRRVATPNVHEAPVGRNGKIWTGVGTEPSGTIIYSN